MAKLNTGVRKPGKRGKTRSKLKKKNGKITVNKIMQEFTDGDRVQVVIEPDYHAGFPDKSFHGLTGKICGRKGESYEIELKKGNKLFTVVTTPVHIKKLK